MARFAGRPWLAAIIALAALAVALRGYDCWLRGQDRQRREAEMNRQEARHVAAVGLTAIRRGDIRTLGTILFRQGFDWLALEKPPPRGRRLVSYIATTYGIRTLTDLQIQRSLDVCGDQPVALMASILRWCTVSPARARATDHPACVLVRCNLPNHPLVIMCVKEDGSWKMVSLPVLSARILRYRR